jgi:gamma-glutamylcyclotransferase (GGCT)/AIG2-like uncharacterized protein YtfP
VGLLEYGLLGVGMNLFVYGSLLVPLVFERLTGVSRQGIPALLEGYARYPLSGEVYPGLMEESGAATIGLLVDDISPLVLDMLDQFEGADYERRSVEVLTLLGNVAMAETYILTPCGRSQIVPVFWDVDVFVSQKRWQRLEEWSF